MHVIELHYHRYGGDGGDVLTHLFAPLIQFANVGCVDGQSLPQTRSDKASSLDRVSFYSSAKIISAVPFTKRAPSDIKDSLVGKTGAAVVFVNWINGTGGQRRDLF